MTSSVSVRPAQPHDYAAWRPLWDGYNAFYGRFGATALPEHITQTTWQRLHDAAEPMLCLVAQDDASGDLLGLAHCVFHRSMTRIEPVCYLSDLFTREAARGRGWGGRSSKGCMPPPAQPGRSGCTGKPKPPTPLDASCTTSWPSTKASSCMRTSFERTQRY